MSNLSKMKRSQNNDFVFWGTGGDAMIRQGLQCIKNIRDLEAIGLEILIRYPFFIKLIKKITNMAKGGRKFVVDQNEKKTDLAILIDYPGFNLKLAQRLNKIDIPVIYYVAPQVWAWYYSRVKQMRKNIRLLLLLFQFETEIFEKEKIPNVYVGHPVTFSLKKKLTKLPPISGLNKKSGKIITLMPGSRHREIISLLPLFGNLSLEIRKTFPGAKFLVAYNNKSEEKFIKHECQKYNLEPLYNMALRCIEASELVILSSGTATLEVGLLKKPMLVAYKVGFISYHILKRIIKIPYAGMVNIIGGKFIVPEFIQKDASVEKMLPEALDLLNEKSEKRRIMIKELGLISREMDSKDPNKESAKAVFAYIKENLL